MVNRICVQGMTPDAPSSMNFEFATATRILFGSGRVRELPALTKPLGSRVMVVTGRSGSRADGLLEALRAEGLMPTTFAVEGEPTTTMIKDAVRQAREAGTEVVIGLGGGSAIDAGKAIAAMLTNRGDLLDYLEIIGGGRALTEPPAPFLALPTTAGTGAEVTRNAVLASPEHRVKASLRSSFLLPRVALVDPELTHSLPPAATAATGLDTLTQLIESFVSCRAHPMTDALCREGLARVARSLPLAFEHAKGEVRAEPSTVATFKGARQDMSLASLFSGIALANAGLGVVHAFAAPIGGRFHAPHGAICAALLPYATAVNLRALRERAPESAALGRYAEVAELLTGQHGATGKHLVPWMTRWVEALEVQPLSRHGMGSRDADDLAHQAGNSTSMKGNPIPLSHAERVEILQLALAA
jgi:alcohol dehydrogenase class IV